VSDWQNIIVERSGSLGRIVLNRPDARNPLDRTTATEILAALRQHFADKKIRSVVITGAGKAFCAGGDLSQMRNFAEMSAEEAYEWPRPIIEAHKLMLEADKPVIAAVNGAAHAGGMGLAGMCDVVLSLRSASFSLPEAKVGLFPMIVIAHLVRAMPRKLLLEMMLTGRPIGAEDAWRIGFVNRLADTEEELEELVQTYARDFEAVSPLSIRLGRRAFALMADLPAPQALDAAQFLNLPFFLGEDLQEGAGAFLEKRKPQWPPGRSEANRADDDDE
jgi:methylglutaconyl-CoA hydratase